MVDPTTRGVRVKCPTHGKDNIHCRHGLNEYVCEDCSTACNAWYEAVKAAEKATEVQRNTPMPDPTNPTPATLTGADLDALEALHEAVAYPWLAGENEGDWPCAITAHPRPDLTVRICDDMDTLDETRLVVATRNALPALLALARKGLEAQLDAGTEKLAAALAEVERLRGRLEKADTFSWRDADGHEWEIHTFARHSAPERAGATWNVCKGIRLHAHAVTLEEAWSAAEERAARDATKGGENP